MEKVLLALPTEMEGEVMAVVVAALAAVLAVAAATLVLMSAFLAAVVVFLDVCASQGLGMSVTHSLTNV